MTPDQHRRQAALHRMFPNAQAQGLAHQQELLATAIERRQRKP